MLYSYGTSVIQTGHVQFTSVSTIYSQILENISKAAFQKGLRVFFSKENQVCLYILNCLLYFSELIESTDKLFELEEEFEILSV